MFFQDQFDVSPPLIGPRSKSNKIHFIGDVLGVELRTKRRQVVRHALRHEQFLVDRRAAFPQLSDEPTRRFVTGHRRVERLEFLVEIFASKNWPKRRPNDQLTEKMRTTRMTGDGTDLLAGEGEERLVSERIDFARPKKRLNDQRTVLADQRLI